MLCTSSSYCYIICCDLQPNTDSDHNQHISVNWSSIKRDMIFIYYNWRNLC